RGSGADFWDDADGGYFLCRSVTRDFQITVRMLARPTDSHRYAKAGLMIRESLDAGARDAYLVVHRAVAGLCFQWRRSAETQAGGADPTLLDARLKLPLLLRLSRRGSTITAAYSPDDGRTWRPAGEPLTFDAPLAPAVFAGLAITAHDSTQTSEARFDRLRLL